MMADIYLKAQSDIEEAASCRVKHSLSCTVWHTYSTPTLRGAAAASAFGLRISQLILKQVLSESSDLGSLFLSKI